MEMEMEGPGIHGGCAGGRGEGGYFIFPPESLSTWRTYLIVDTREENNHDRFLTQRTAAGENPSVSVADPLGSPKRRTREQGHYIACGRRVRACSSSL